MIIEVPSNGSKGMEPIIEADRRRERDDFQYPQTGRGGCNSMLIVLQRVTQDFQYPQTGRGGCNEQIKREWREYRDFQYPQTGRGGCNRDRRAGRVIVVRTFSTLKRVKSSIAQMKGGMYDYELSHGFTT